MVGMVLMKRDNFMELDRLEYWNNYDVNVLLAEPAPANTHSFFPKRVPPSEAGELALEIPTNKSDWLFLKLQDYEGGSWTGEFEPGVEGISGLYATPSESVLCIVTRGQGYWVPVCTPQTYEVIPSTPIKKVIAVPEAELMIFVDFVRLTAYNADGFAWQTDSLSWDGLKIVEVLRHEINGVAWDAPDNKEVPFSVDVKNGSHTGGSSPETYAS